MIENERIDKQKRKKRIIFCYCQFFLPTPKQTPKSLGGMNRGIQAPKERIRGMRERTFNLTLSNYEYILAHTYTEWG